MELLVHGKIASGHLGLLLPAGVRGEVGHQVSGPLPEGALPEAGGLGDEVGGEGDPERQGRVHAGAPPAPAGRRSPILPDRNPSRRVPRTGARSRRCTGRRWSGPSPAMTTVDEGWWETHPASCSDRSLQRVLLRKERNGLRGHPARRDRVLTDDLACGVVGRSGRRHHGRASGTGRQSSDGRGGGRRTARTPSTWGPADGAGGATSTRCPTTTCTPPSASPTGAARSCGWPSTPTCSPTRSRPCCAKMERFVSWGVDGAIMTDIGAIAEVHRQLPAPDHPRQHRGQHPQQRGRALLPLDRRLAGRGGHEADPQGAGLPEASRSTSGSRS